MIARDIVRFPVLYDSTPAAISRARPSMMLNLEIREAPGGPVQHVGFHLVDRVGTGPHPQPRQGASQQARRYTFAPPRT